MAGRSPGGRALAALGVIAALLALPGAATADVLSRTEAGARVKRHAQATIDHPQTPFVFATFACVGDANHEKTCTVNYDTPQTRAEEQRRQAAWVCPRVPGPVQPPCGPRRPKRLAPWACTERLVAYYNPHTRTFPHPLPKPGEGIGDLTIYLRYASARCGPLLYSSPRPRLQARSAGQPIGSIVWISADTRSASGQYLRVGIAHSGVGAAAVLKAPENRPDFPNNRRAQQWRVERNLAANYPYSIRFRNVFSDKCLTAARPRGSPVYLQNCGSILGQAWAYQANGMIWSMNYNQTFPAGCSCTTMDITEFRNVPGTALQVARHTGKWNQIWDINIVPASLR